MFELYDIGSMFLETLKSVGRWMIDTDLSDLFDLIGLNGDLITSHIGNPSFVYLFVGGGLTLIISIKVISFIIDIFT